LKKRLRKSIMLNSMAGFADEKIWRILTNFWTLLFMAFLIADFFLQGRYEFLTAPLSVIYVGILGLYVGTKEFDRWYERHEGRHPGELFVAFWTIVIFVLLVLSLLLGGGYRLSSEAVAVYIMVLSVFAITQKSKSLYKIKKGRSGDK